MFDVRKATDRIFHRVNRSGEEVKNDLPNWVSRFIEAEGWKSVVNPATGEAFENVGQWLVANYPLGPGMGVGRFSITYDEFIVLCEDRPKLKDMLIRFRPKGKRGRPAVSDNEKHSNGMNKEAARKPGNSRLYIEERLQRDHPEIWQDYLDGNFKSARQAAIQAGFVKDTHDPLMRLKANWNKASKKQRREFLKWVEEA
jgi:hypothetical protein